MVTLVRALLQQSGASQDVEASLHITVFVLWTTGSTVHL